MKTVYALLSVLIFVISCSGQNIVSGTKDSHGTIWFTVSDRAVFRYDAGRKDSLGTGKTFTNFTKENFKSNLKITSFLYEDKSGHLWFNTNKGLHYYDGQKFTTFQLPLPPESLAGPDKYSTLSRIPVQVWKMSQDKNENFWFLTNDHGVYQYHTKQKDSLGYEKSFSNFLLEETPNCILETKKGDIYIGSWEGGGVYRYEALPGVQPTFKSFGGFNDGMIACLTEDKTGNIWVGTRNRSVDRYDAWRNDSVGPGKTVVNFSKQDGLTDNCIYCVYEDSKGNIWLGADAMNHVKRGDAFCYDGKSFTNITANVGLTNVDGFVYNVKSIVEDNAGNIWIGSTNGLLLCYDGKKVIDFSEKLK